MKNKKEILSNNSKNKIVILVFLAAGFLTLNTLESSLYAHILGIAFLIAGVYSIIALGKKKPLLF